MLSIAEIQQAIQALPADEYAQLREWLTELDWSRWNGQLKAVSETGELDSLIDEADQVDELSSLDDL